MKLLNTNPVQVSVKGLSGEIYYLPVGKQSTVSEEINKPLPAGVVELKETLKEVETEPVKVVAKKPKSKHE